MGGLGSLLWWGVAGDEFLVVGAALPDPLVWPTAVGALGGIRNWLFTVHHQVAPRTCPAPGPSLTILVCVRIVQATGAYRWPLTVFWLHGDALGKDFG